MPVPIAAAPTPYDPSATPPPPSRRRRRGPLIAGATLLAIAAGICLGEWAGWPFLIEPLRGRMEKALERPVTIEGRGKLHLFGSVRLDVPKLQIADASWARGPALLAVEDLHLRMRYRDLWAAGRGQGVHVDELTAQSLSTNLERRANGDANWTVGPQDTAQPDKPRTRLSVNHLMVNRFSGQYNDALLAADAKFSGALTAGDSNGPGGLRAEATGHYRQAVLKAQLRSDSPLPLLTGDASQVPPVGVVLNLDAGQVRLDFDGTVRDVLGQAGLKGTYKLQGPSLAAVGQPLGVTLPTTEDFNMRGEIERDGTRWKTHVTSARVGRSMMGGNFVFDTAAQRPMLTGALQASVIYPADLAPAVGAPADPATAKAQPDDKVLPQREFDLPSLKAMDAAVDFNIVRLPIGKDGTPSITPLEAKLTLDNGNLQFNIRRAQLGDGRIAGTIGLAVADKNPPASKADTTVAAASAAATGADAATSAAAAKISANTASAATRVADSGPAVAPPRAANPPALSASDPFGVRAERGLPTEVSAAHWTTDLRWSGIALEQVIPPRASAAATPDKDSAVAKAAAKKGKVAPVGGITASDSDKAAKPLPGEQVQAGTAGAATPYVSGRLAGRVKLEGNGRSTAQILGSASGNAQVLWTRGTVSHLLVEAAGLDLMQSLGILIQGDEPLRVDCGAGSLTFNTGLVQPVPLVIDTKDSTLWIDGDVSLKTEKLALRAMVAPKDNSLISLRTPVRVRGTMANPSISIEKGPLIEKAAPAVLLAAFVHPLAALIPLIDTGDEEGAKQADAACRGVAERIAKK